MSGQWKEVVRLAFKGQRFRDHALDLSALAELSQFQRIVAETAKTLWRAAHPDRERLPKRFQDRTRLCLRRIEGGSAVAPLEVFIEEPEAPELFDVEPTEINEAIDLAHKVFIAAQRDGPVPENCPKDLVAQYARWGSELADDDVIEVIPVGREPARFTRVSRSRLADFTEAPHQTNVDITGEVLEADIRQGRFQLWLDANTGVAVKFSPEQEDEVTTALKEHRTRRLQVKGKGELSPQGKPLRVMEVAKLQFHPVGEVPYDASAAPIEDVLSDLAREVPKDEWDRLPQDLTDNLDHYLYGTPKR